MFGKSARNQKAVLSARIVGLAAIHSPKPQDCLDSLSAAAKENRARRESRYVSGILTLSFGERLPVVVKDLSKTGARVEFMRQVIFDETPVLLSASPALPKVRAYVVWQERGAAGLRFETPIDLTGGS
ncbi:MAG: hypothetical protein Q8R02_04120 [Hyphomonadaceae bacterium]|nr:hypothetical protein [Hyphomonadaceae bacterium]